MEVETKYILKLSHEEAVTLKRALGMQSPKERLERASITQEQSEILSDLYNELPFEDED